MAGNLGIRTTPRLMRIKRVLQSAFGMIAKTATFLAIAIVGGSLSSWYAVEGGTRFNTQRIGPWTQWSNAGRPDSDPYSRVRFSKRQELVFNANLSARYEALSDSGGRLLYSSCDYVLEGMRVPGTWWSLAVFDGEGRLIPNPAERYGYNASTVMKEPDGSFVIRLSRDAKPQNWIPTARAGRLIVILEIQQRTGAASLVTDQDGIILPEIKRSRCR